MYLNGVVRRRKDQMDPLMIGLDRLLLAKRPQLYAALRPGVTTGALARSRPISDIDPLSSATCICGVMAKMLESSRTFSLLMA